MRLDHFKYSPSLQLQQGASSARSADIDRLTETIATLLNAKHKPDINAPYLKTSDRSNRGLEHLLCGKLICPIDFDWDDDE
jgi:hypothetical protein